MFNLRRHGRAKMLAAVTIAGLATMSLAGCGSSDTGGGTAGTGSAADLDAALEKGGEITYWTWTPQAEAQVAAFEKQYPNVKVNVVNAGTATDEYTKLSNAISAGSGAPDVAQIEYYALQQYALSDSLLDLGTYGMGELQDKYTASTWGAVNVNDKLVALPQDSGPMVMFYNKAVFDQYGLTVPTTWDEYIAEAKKLNAADSSKFITNDAGDPGYADPLIWQAGGRPFQTNGDQVTINLQDEGTKKWADTWNQLLEPKLIANIPTWSDDWYKALGNGTLATIITGAWMPGILEGSLPEGAGNWRVAPIPSYDGTPVSAENGGSSQAVIKQSKNPALAAAFLRWLNSSDESITTFLDGGGFPSTTAQLEDPTFLNATPEYFGGQEINKVLVDASKNVSDGWQYLPFQVYANSVFPDTVGQAYANNSDLNTALEAWQNNLVNYGNQQGFNVNK